MQQSDTAFTGTIADAYDEFLVPVMFEPFARDLARRAAEIRPRDVLEIAAGTGVVTRLLAAALPDARIIATDLNPAMIDLAGQHLSGSDVSFGVADAQALEYPSASFDLVVCQFGAMFFADRAAAYGHARRVLRPGGVLLLNVWDRLDLNTGSQAIHDAVNEALPEPKPGFLARTPFGYHNREMIGRELAAAGFSSMTIEQLHKAGRAGDGARLAQGLCLGSPLAGEIAQHDSDRRQAALDAALAAVAAVERDGPLQMTALVITARS